MNRRTRASSQSGKKALKTVSNSFVQKKAKVAKTAKRKLVKAVKAEVKKTINKLKDIKDGGPKQSSSKLQEPESEENEARDNKGDCENKAVGVLETDNSKVKRQNKGEVTNPISVRLTEHDAGITEYISTHCGFSGIIKQRYSDFHVNEIDNDGNIVTLTSTDVPVEKSQRVEDSLDYLKSSLSGELFKKLVLLFDSKVDEVEIEATDLSKDARRKLHMAVLNCGKSTLMSNTVEKDSKKYITVRKKNIGKPDRRSSDWPSERGGDYVHFALHKENMDTMETVNIIAGKLRIRPSMITYAGTKDRRAKTTQLMSVRKIEPSRLAAISRGLKGIELGNYKFQKYPLELGDLKGNRFRIVLRNVKASDKQIEEAITSLKTKGFINYYGLQRFGTSLTVPTYEIGKALLQGQWKKAVELVLKPRREDESCRFLSEARKIWWETRDASLAFKVLRNKNKSLEGKLLLGLSRSGAENYLSALDNIPRNTRLMYLHSYQSLLWNKIVSRRIKEFGLMPLVGDLVLQGNEVIPFEPDDFAETVDQDSSTKVAGDQAVDGNNKHKPKVSVLTEANLSSASIFDVVLPLPGHDIEYPRNEIGLWFEELLHKDGLSSAKLKQTVKTYSLGGTYRKLVVCPTNMNWKVMHYSDPQTTLVLSDLEQMQKVDPPKDVKGGVYKALLLDFCLPSSTYATMAIREILKIDTSCYNQSLLNDYHLSGSSTSSGQPVANSQTAEVTKSCQMETADTRSTRSRFALSSAIKTREEPSSTIENEGEPEKKKQKMLREKSARLQSNKNAVKDSQLEVMRTRRASVENKKIECNVLTDTNKAVQGKLSSLRSTSRRLKLENKPCQSIVGGKRISADGGPTRKDITVAKCKKLNVSDKTKTVEVKTNERRPVRNASLKNSEGAKRKIDKVEQVEVNSEIKMGLRRRSAPVSEPDVKRLKTVTRKNAKSTSVSDSQSCKPKIEKRISRITKTKTNISMKKSNKKANQGGKLNTEPDNIDSDIKTEDIEKDTKDLTGFSPTCKSELEYGVGTQLLEKEDVIKNSICASKDLSKLPEIDTVKLDENGMGNLVCNLTSELDHTVHTIELEVDEISSSIKTDKLENEDSKVNTVCSSTITYEKDSVAGTKALQKEDDTENIVSTSKTSIKIKSENNSLKLEKEREMGNAVCSSTTSVFEHAVEVDKSNFEREEMNNEDGELNIVCTSTTKSEVDTKTLVKEDDTSNIVSTSKSSCELEHEVHLVKLGKEDETENIISNSIPSEIEHMDDALLEVEVGNVKNNIEREKLDNLDSKSIVVSYPTEKEHAVDKLALEKKDTVENIVSTLKSSCTLVPEIIGTVKSGKGIEMESTVCSSIDPVVEHLVKVDRIKNDIVTEKPKNEDSEVNIVCSSAVKSELECVVGTGPLEKEDETGNIVSMSKSSCEVEPEIDKEKLDEEGKMGNIVCSSVNSELTHMVDAVALKVDIKNSIEKEKLDNEDSEANIIFSSETTTEQEDAVDKLIEEQENDTRNIVTITNSSRELEPKIDTVKLDEGDEMEKTVCSSVTSEVELMVEAAEVEVSDSKSNSEKEKVNNLESKSNVDCCSTTKTKLEHVVDKLTMEKEDDMQNIVTTSKLSCELDTEIDIVKLRKEDEMKNTVCNSIAYGLEHVVEDDQIKSSLQQENLENKASQLSIVGSPVVKSKLECVVGTVPLEKEDETGNIVSMSKSSCEVEPEIDKEKLDEEGKMGNIVCSSMNSELTHMVDAVALEVDIKNSIEKEKLDNEDSEANIIFSSETTTEQEDAVDKLIEEQENNTRNIVTTTKSSRELEPAIDTAELDESDEMENTVCSSMTSEVKLMVEAAEVEVSDSKSNIEKEKVNNLESKSNVDCCSTAKTKLEHAVDKLIEEQEDDMGNTVTTTKLSRELEPAIDTVKLDEEGGLNNTVCSSITSELENVVDIVKIENEECTESTAVNTAIVSESVDAVDIENVKDLSDGCLTTENSSGDIKSDITGTPVVERSKIEGNVDIDLNFSGSECNETSVTENINVIIKDSDLCKKIVCNKFDVDESPTVFTTSKKTDDERKNYMINNISEECNVSLQMSSKLSDEPLCDVLDHQNIVDSNNHHMDHIEKKSSCTLPPEVEMSNSWSDSSLTVATNVLSNCNSLMHRTVETVCDLSNTITNSVNDQSHVSAEKPKCGVLLGVEEREIQNSTTDISKNIDNSLEKKLCSESIGGSETSNKETVVEQKVEISQATQFSTDSLLKTQPTEIDFSSVSTLNEDAINKQSSLDLNLDCKTYKVSNCTSIENCKTNDINAGQVGQENVEMFLKSNIPVMKSTKDCDQNLESFGIQHKSSDRMIHSCASDNNVDKTVTADPCEKPESAKRNVGNNQNTNATNFVNSSKIVPVEDLISQNCTEQSVHNSKTEGEVELFDKLNVDSSKNLDNSNRGKSEKSELENNNLKSKNQCIINNTNLNNLDKTILESSEVLEISSTHEMCQIVPIEVSETMESLSDHPESSDFIEDVMQKNSVTYKVESVSSDSAEEIKEMLKEDLNSQSNIMEIDHPVGGECDVSPKNNSANICLEETVSELSEPTSVSAIIETHEINNVKDTTCQKILSSETINIEPQKGDNLIKCDIAVETKEINVLNDNTNCSEVVENIDGKLKENLFGPINEVNDINAESCNLADFSKTGTAACEAKLESDHLKSNKLISSCAVAENENSLEFSSENSISTTDTTVQLHNRKETSSIADFKENISVVLEDCSEVIQQDQESSISAGKNSEASIIENLKPEEIVEVKSKDGNNIEISSLSNKEGYSSKFNVNDQKHTDKSDVTSVEELGYTKGKTTTTTHALIAATKDGSDADNFEKLCPSITENSNTSHLIETKQFITLAESKVEFLEEKNESSLESGLPDFKGEGKDVMCIHSKETETESNMEVTGELLINNANLKLHSSEILEDSTPSREGTVESDRVKDFSESTAMQNEIKYDDSKPELVIKPVLMGNISMSVESDTSSSTNSIRPDSESTDLDLCTLNVASKIKIEEGVRSSSMNNHHNIEIDISTSVNNGLVKPFNSDSETVLNEPINQSSEFVDEKPLECNSGKSDDRANKDIVDSDSETNFLPSTLNEKINVKKHLKPDDDTLSSTCSSTSLTYDLNTKSNLEGSEPIIPSSGVNDVNTCKGEILSGELSVKMQKTGNECDTKLPTSSLSVNILSNNTSQKELDICSQTQSYSSNVDCEKESVSTNKLLQSYQIVATNETVDLKKTVLCIPRGKEFTSNLQSELQKVSSPGKNVELKTDFYKCISGNSESKSGEAAPQAKCIAEHISSVKNLEKNVPDQKLLALNPNKNESINCLYVEKTISNLENSSSSKGETLVLSTQDESSKSSSETNIDFMLAEENSSNVMSAKKSESSENVSKSEASPKTPPSNLQNESVKISTDSDRSVEELESTKSLISLEQIPSVNLSSDNNSIFVPSLERNTIEEIERLQSSLTESKQKLTYSPEHLNPAVKRKNEDSESEVKKVKVAEVSDSDALKTSVQSKRKVDASDLCSSIEDNVETKKLKES